MSSKVPIVSPASPNKHAKLAKAAARGAKSPSPSKPSKRYELVVETYARPATTESVGRFADKQAAKDYHAKVSAQFQSGLEKAWNAWKPTRSGTRDAFSFVDSVIALYGAAVGAIASGSPLSAKDVVAKLGLAWATDMKRTYDPVKDAKRIFEMCHVIEGRIDGRFGDFADDNLRVKPVGGCNSSPCSSPAKSASKPKPKPKAGGGGGGRCCSYCGEPGHYKPKCPARLKAATADDSDSDDSDEVTESDAEDFADFMGSDAEDDDEDDDAEDDAEDDDEDEDEE